MKYQIDQSEPLGDGTYSICLRCRNRTTNKEYAVKVVNAAHEVELEIEALKVCQGNRNIVKLVDNLEDQHYKYIVLEILKGGELFSQIRNCKQLTESQAKTYFKQLLDAVKFMHSKKIIHRDLKPENIMFKNSDQLKIVDFGFACRKSSKEMFPQYTLDYASPESFVKGAVDETQDIWSLGAILYTMLCGNSPFTPLNFTENPDDKLRRKCQMDKILKGKFNTNGVNWEHLSSDVKSLIRSMLCVKPKDRLSIEEISSHAWLQDPKPIINNHHYDVPLALHEMNIAKVEPVSIKPQRNNHLKNDNNYHHERNGDVMRPINQDLQISANNDQVDLCETLDLSCPNLKSEAVVTNHCTKPNNHEPKKRERKKKQQQPVVEITYTRSQRQCAEGINYKEGKRRGQKRLQSSKSENVPIKKRKVSEADENCIGFSPSDGDDVVDIGDLAKWEFCLNYNEMTNGEQEILQNGIDDNSVEPIIPPPPAKMNMTREKTRCRLQQLAAKNNLRPSLLHSSSIQNRRSINKEK